MDYLYSDQDEYIETPQIPTLALPLRVGIAFVPEMSSYSDNVSLMKRHEVRDPALTERDKMELMKEVSKHFKHYEFVKSIDLIPSAYLRKRGGFTNLDQIRTMYGIDVIALISYDQKQFIDQGLSSIAYWTIIGAYVVPGEKNDTHTMVDTTVYDINSKKMLFRAPGISNIKHKAPPVNLAEQLRKDRMEGYREASKDLIVNLDIQLDLFKEKIKESPEEYKIIHKRGYTGGGSLDGLLVLFLGIFAGFRLWQIKQSIT